MHTLSIIVPVFNEEKRITRFFQSLGHTRFPSSIKPKELIVVDDGSTDQTAALLSLWKEKLKKQLNLSVEIISYKTNKGKGYAVRRGMKLASGEYALLMDVDLSTPFSEVKKFVPAMNNGASVIIGTRKTGAATISVPQPLHRQVMGKGFTLMSRVILNTWISDFTCGFKMFHQSARRVIFSKAQINRWGYDAELMFIARLLHFDILEIPVKWKHDAGSKVRLLKDIKETAQELFSIRAHDFNGKYSSTFLVRNSKVLIQVFSKPSVDLE